MENFNELIKRMENRTSNDQLLELFEEIIKNLNSKEWRLIKIYGIGSGSTHDFDMSFQISREVI